jgi:hypothetical protein
MPLIVDRSNLPWVLDGSSAWIELLLVDSRLESDAASVSALIRSSF